MVFELLPNRQFPSTTENCLQFAGENKTTLKCVFEGLNITTLCSAIVYDTSRKLWYFDFTTATAPRIGDSFRLWFGVNIQFVSVKVITSPSAGVFRLFFDANLSASPAVATQIDSWLKFDHALVVTFNKSGTPFLVARNSFRPSSDGTTLINLSEMAQPFIQRFFSFDSTNPALNQIEPSAQLTVQVSIQEMFYRVVQTTFAPFPAMKFTSSAFQLLAPKSNNVVDYVINPNSDPLGKPLSVFEQPIHWQGFPSFFNFIWNDNLVNITIESSEGLSLPLDSIGRTFPNVVLLREEWLDANKVCFWLGGEILPPPPDPPSLPARRREITFHIRNDQAYAEYTVIEPILFELSWTFNGFIAPSAIWKINGTAYPFATWIATLPTTLIGDVLRVEVGTPAAVLPYGTDWLFYLRYGTNDTTVYPFYRQKLYNFSDAKVGCDFLQFLCASIEVNPNTLVQSPMNVGIRRLSAVYEDYTLFPYNLSSGTDIALLQAELDLILDGTQYALHFQYGWNGKYPSGTPLLSGNQDGAFQYRYKNAPMNDFWFLMGDAGENSNPNYATALANNGAVYNGIDRYDLIDNFDCSKLNNGSPFTIHLGFFVDDVTNVGMEGYRTIFSTEYQDIGGGARVFYIVQKNGYIDIGFGVGVNQSFNCFAPIKTGWNTLIFSYDGRDNVTGGAGFTVISNDFNGFVFSTVNFAPTTSWSCWTGLTTRATIGAFYQQGFGAFGYHKGKVRICEIWAGYPITSAPNAMEYRTLHNTKSALVVGQGEPFDPTSVSAFSCKLDFNQTGANPITVLEAYNFTTPIVLPITSLGAKSYTTYL